MDIDIAPGYGFVVLDNEGPTAVKKNDIVIGMRQGGGGC